MCSTDLHDTHRHFRKGQVFALGFVEPGAFGDVFLVNVGAELRGIELGGCVDEAGVVKRDGFLAFGVIDEVDVVAVGSGVEEADAGFFEDFALEGLEEGFAMEGAAAGKVPGVAVGAAGFFNEENVGALFNECVDAEVELLHGALSVVEDKVAAVGQGFQKARFFLKHPPYL